MVFLGIFEQYVLGDRPEGNFFVTSFHSSFIALGTVNSGEPRYTILQLGLLNSFG
jgi:hypothetical protein